MKCKLFSNMKRMTNGFLIGILCVTVSVLTLRLTVFSDMAAAPESSGGSLLSSEEDSYQLNSTIYFSSPTAKGDVFITNLSSEHLIRVDITLADSGKSILYTGSINPGVSIKSYKMNSVGQRLENGKYDCIAEISAYDPNDIRTLIGSTKVEIQVYIGEKPSSK